MRHCLTLIPRDRRFCWPALLLCLSTLAHGQISDLGGIGDDLERPTISENLGGPGEVGLLEGSRVPFFDEQRARELEEAIYRKAVAIADPLQRSQALERLAQSSIREGLALTSARERPFDRAHELLVQAGNSGLEAQPALRRDLRLMATIDSLLKLADAQVVQALSVSRSGSERGPQVAASDLPEPLENRRLSRLSLAREEWQLAYRLAENIQNINYRCEETFQIATQESLGSQSISRTGLRGSLYPIVPEVPRDRLLSIADTLMVDAARQAYAIPRTMWRDRAMVIVTVNAAEAWQHARARSIAVAIPDAESRAEALMQTSEQIILAASRIENVYPSYVRAASARLENELAAARGDLQADARIDQGRREEVLFNLRRKRESLQSLYQSSEGLLELVDLLTQLTHNARVAQATSSGSAMARPSPTSLVSGLDTGLARTIQPLRDLRDTLKTQLNVASDAMYDFELRPTSQLRDFNDPFIDVAAKLPTADEVAQLSANLDGLVTEVLRLAKQVLPEEATEIYNLAARAVASVSGEDPRNEQATILIESLIGVARFDDARAATVLLPDPQRRIRLLGDIAEQQGRLGLVQSADAWITTDVAENRQAEMFRRLENGLLNSVDENRLRRSLSLPGLE